MDEEQALKSIASASKAYMQGEITIEQFRYKMIEALIACKEPTFLAYIADKFEWLAKD